jgi:hypothetical protein
MKYDSASPGFFWSLDARLVSTVYGIGLMKRPLADMSDIGFIEAGKKTYASGEGATGTADPLQPKMQGWTAARAYSGFLHLRRLCVLAHIQS